MRKRSMETYPYEYRYEYRKKTVEELLIETIINQIRLEPHRYNEIISAWIDLLTPHMILMIKRSTPFEKKIFWRILEKSWDIYFPDIPNPLKFENIDIDLLNLYQLVKERIENPKYHERFLERYFHGSIMVRGSEEEKRLKEIISQMLFNAYIEFLRKVKGLI
jgi:hypothetical protein